MQNQPDGGWRGAVHDFKFVVTADEQDVRSGVLYMLKPLQLGHDFFERCLNDLRRVIVGEHHAIDVSKEDGAIERLSPLQRDGDLGGYGRRNPLMYGLECVGYSAFGVQYPNDSSPNFDRSGQEAIHGRATIATERRITMAIRAIR